MSQEERGSLCRSLLEQGMIRQGEAHQASVYPRRILMRRASRGAANVYTDIHKPNRPLILRITFNSRYSLTSVLNNRGTTQFASFATKVCEFNEGGLDNFCIKKDTKLCTIFAKINEQRTFYFMDFIRELLFGFYLAMNSIA